MRPESIGNHLLLAMFVVENKIIGINKV